MKKSGSMSLLLSPGELCVLMALAQVETPEGLPLPAVTEQEIDDILFALEESGIVSVEGDAIAVSSAYHSICRAMGNCEAMLRAGIGDRKFSAYFHSRLSVAVECPRRGLVRLTPAPSWDEALTTLQEAVKPGEQVQLALVTKGREGPGIRMAGEEFCAMTARELIDRMHGRE